MRNRTPRHAFGRPRTDQSPALSSIGHCPITRSNGEQCTRPGMPGLPFVICQKHARVLYETMHAAVHASLGLTPEQERYLGGGPPPERPARPGTVYWLQVGELIKVGFTVNLKQRLQSYPPNTRVLALEPQATRELEARRIDQFRHLLAHPNEWFHPAPELIAHINVLRPDDQQIDLDQFPGQASA